MPEAGLPRRALRTTALAGLVLAMAFCGLLVLVVAGMETGPAAFGLAVLLAVLPVPLWIAVVLWADRFEPEPVRLLALAFVWGATVAAFAALVINTIGELIVADALDESAAELYGASISAPVVEEVAKAAVLFGIFWWRRREFDGVLDGIVYASMVGLGFAMTENVLYYGRGAVEEGVVGAVATFVVRGLMSPFAHPFFTAMVGIGLGLAVHRRSRVARVALPLAGLGVAMALHSLWNTAAGSGLFLGVYVLIMMPAFIVLIGIAIASLRREGRVVREELAGVLPEEEVAHLGRLRARRRTRREAKRRGGRRARRAVAEYQSTATELAFARRRGDRDREAELRHRCLEELRPAAQAALTA